jgi:hypothetical protein
MVVKILIWFFAYQAAIYGFGMWLSLVERCVRDAKVAGSNPVIPTSHGGIAQMGERLNGIQEASGSIPLISTTAVEIFGFQRLFYIPVKTEIGKRFPYPCFHCFLL